MKKSYSWWITRGLQDTNAKSADLKNGSASHLTQEENGIVGDTGQTQHQNKDSEKKKEGVVQSGEVKLKLKKDSENSSDMVNHPPHYTKSSIECIDVIKEALGDGYENYLQGVILKYIWRYNYKGEPVEDLKKAQWYLEELIEIKENK